MSGEDRTDLGQRARQITRMEEGMRCLSVDNADLQAMGRTGCYDGNEDHQVEDRTDLQAEEEAGHRVQDRMSCRAKEKQIHRLRAKYSAR